MISDDRTQLLAVLASLNSSLRHLGGQPLVTDTAAASYETAESLARIVRATADQLAWLVEVLREQQPAGHVERLALLIDYLNEQIDAADRTDPQLSPRNPQKP